MALLEDIISIILIVFFLIILSGVLSGYMFTEQLESIEQRQNFYLEDYYSTSLDSFLNHRESNTTLPNHILIGNYIARGERTAIGKNGSQVDVQKQLNQTLNEFYGKNDYYQMIRQDYTNTTLSFVIDGSDSNRIERQIINDTVGDIENSVEQLFGDSNAQVTSEIYVLGNDDQCQGFEGDCDLLSEDQLYDSSNAPSGPWFSQSNRIEHYVESDWIAGSIEAEERFRSDLQSEREVHIVIPVFDQISTSSVPDFCFDRNNNLDYSACRLCYQEEPCNAANRSEQDMKKLVSFFNERSPNSVVMPVFSFDCNFQDFIGWKNWDGNVNNEDVQDHIEHSSGDLASDEGLCHLDNCEACSAPSEGDDAYIEPESTSYNNVCFRDSCHAEITNQMMNVTQETNGAYVSIDDREEIAQEVASTIEDVFGERKIEFGVRDEDRTRYVFERRIVLPNFGDTYVKLWAYDTPEREQ